MKYKTDAQKTLVLKPFLVSFIKLFKVTFLRQCKLQNNSFLHQPQMFSNLKRKIKSHLDILNCGLHSTKKNQQQITTFKRWTQLHRQSFWTHTQLLTCHPLPQSFAPQAPWIPRTERAGGTRGQRFLPWRRAPVPPHPAHLLLWSSISPCSAWQRDRQQIQPVGDGIHHYITALVPTGEILRALRFILTADAYCWDIPASWWIKDYTFWGNCTRMWAVC